MPALDRWQRSGWQIRLALQADEPRLVTRYLALAEAVVAEGALTRWAACERSLSLLLSTAYDTELPACWRLVCLDACCRPLAMLGPLVCDDASAGRLRQLSRRLARFPCNSLSFD